MTFATPEDPVGRTHYFAYSGAGLLEHDYEPDDKPADDLGLDGSPVTGTHTGGSKHLTRNKLSSDAHEVSVATAQGRTSIHLAEATSSGGRKRVSTAPDGSSNTTVLTDSTTTASDSTGMVTTLEKGPDPSPRCPVRGFPE